MHTRNGREARDGRRASAAERQAERDKRTDEQQIKRLIKAGHSINSKEVRRLAEKIGAVYPAPEEKKDD